MTDSPLASFLLPEPFARPSLRALSHERTVVGELSRYGVRALEEHTGRRARARRIASAAEGANAPVLLVPGFMAGDLTLRLMATTLRRRGYRTYRSHILANVGCTLQAATALETRLESIAERNAGRRVQIVGHSLGGMIARGIAVRRPDLVSGIVTMGSPMLAPAAHHLALSLGVEALVRLSSVGVPGLMKAECVAGDCARQSFDESRLPVPADVGFTALYSRRDGIVDWRACIDPQAVPVEVRTSHCGMAVDPDVIDEVTVALRRHAALEAQPPVRIA